MDVIVRSNNDPVNDMTAPVSWLINDLDKAIKTKSTQSLPNRCWPLRGWKTRPKKEHHPTVEDGQIGTNHSLPLERGALFNRFFGKPAHGPPHVAGGASGPIGGCRDESRTDNPDLDLRHVFDRNNQKTDLI